MLCVAFGSSVLDISTEAEERQGRHSPAIFLTLKCHPVFRPVGEREEVFMRRV